MEFFLPISYLNDFVFCPYSIYLHQVFDNSVEELYSAKPQQRGKSAHGTVDSSKITKSKVLNSIYVISNEFGIYGKIDQLFLKDQKLVERKYYIKKIYRGYYYQIWAQYFALLEMGFEVRSLFFHSMKDNNRIEIDLPNENDKIELKKHIKKIANFNFEDTFIVNPEKCKRCIYASLCDKTNLEHVYA